MVPIISDQVPKSSFRLFGADISLGPNYYDNLNKVIPQQTSTSNNSINIAITSATNNDSQNSSNGTITTNNGRRQENQERVRKRSPSSEESQNESLKQRKKQQNPRPSKEEMEKANFKPPNLPSELLEKIKGMNGEEPKLIMQKYVFSSDILPRQNRLLIPKKEILKYGQELVLKEEEKRVLEEGDDIDVIVILKNNEQVMNLKLSKWPKPPNNFKKSGNYLIQGGWMEVIKKINLKEGDVAQLWSFRFGQEERLGFIFLQVVDNTQIINQLNTV